MFSVYSGKCLSRKAVHNWVEKFSLGRSKVAEWLRQQSKDSYYAGFDSLVKRWEKCISVGGGYVKFRISDVLRFVFICDLFADSPS
jgi:hypothetical protein